MIKYLAVLPVLGSLFCTSLGFFTFSRNMRHQANVGFLMGMLSLSIAEAGGAVTLLAGSDGGMALFGMRLVLVGQALLPACWLVFSSSFARGKEGEGEPSMWRFVIIPVWILSICFLGLLFSSRLIPDVSYGTDGTFMIEVPIFLFGPLGRYFYVFLILGLVLNLVQLENTLRASRGSKRWQIKYVIIGVGAILFFYVYLASQALLFSAYNLEFILLTSVVTLVSSAVIALFIVRHRLLDVDVFISRYVVYNSVTLLVVGLYLLAVGVVAQGIKYFEIPFSYFFTTIFIFLSILLLVVLLFTASIRRKVQLFINRHFYKHKYEFRDKWMETIDRISSENSVENICVTLSDIIEETMGVRNVNVWLYDAVRGRYRLFNRVYSNDFVTVGNSHPLARLVRQVKKTFYIEDYLEDIQNREDDYIKLKELLSATGAVLCSPMVAGEDVVGFVLQGEDISGEAYRQDDFEFLKAVTTQAAVQIKNINLARDLMAAREMEVFHKMASFIMHDLKNLANTLSLVSQNARYNMDNPDFRKDAVRTIDSTVSRMKGLIEKFSRIPKETVLNKHEVNLKRLVDNALKKVHLGGSKKVVVANRIGDLPPINVDAEAFEMVLINLVANACDAIGEEGKIEITASVDGNTVRISVSDTGRGMSQDFIDKALFRPFKSTKKGGFGIGLYQCKTVIEAHGGSIDVESKEGKGTTFTVSLPLGGVLNGRG